MISWHQTRKFLSRDTNRNNTKSIPCSKCHLSLSDCDTAQSLQNQIHSLWLSIFIVQCSSIEVQTSFWFRFCKGKLFLLCFWHRTIFTWQINRSKRVIWSILGKTRASDGFSFRFLSGLQKNWWEIRPICHQKSMENGWEAGEKNMIWPRTHYFIFPQTNFRKVLISHWNLWRSGL